MGPSAEPVYMWSLCDAVLNLPAHALLLHATRPSWWPWIRVLNNGWAILRSIPYHKHGSTKPHTGFSLQEFRHDFAWLCSNCWLLRSLSFASWLWKTGSQTSYLFIYFVEAICGGNTFSAYGSCISTLYMILCLCLSGEKCCLIAVPSCQAMTGVRIKVNHILNILLL